jgi:hypothetical protein
MCAVILGTAVAGRSCAGGKYRPEAVNDQVISMGKPIMSLPRCEADKPAEKSD